MASNERSTSSARAEKRESALPVRASQPVPLERGATSPDELLGLALEPGARDVARRMLLSGASSDMCRSVLAEVVRAGARGAFAIDAAARSIGALPAILPSPKRPRGHALPPVIAFVGPTGVGKTSSLVKLGRRLRETGRKVVFASLDPLALGALERATGIEKDVDRGEVPLAIVRDLGDLRRSLRRGGGADAVLLDTPGFSPRDDALIDELARELSRLRPLFELQTLLVLPATDARGSLRLASRAFARTRPDGVVLTKLDESDEPAAALEELARARLPLAFLADGQDTRAHLVRPTPERFADLVLRGRLA